MNNRELWTDLSRGGILRRDNRRWKRPKFNAL